MKNELIDFILLLVSLALIAFGLYHLNRHIEEPQPVIVDHYIDKVIFDTVWLDHYDTLTYHHQDTVWENGEIVIVEDTVEVPVPITAEHFDTTIYQGDSVQTQIKGVIKGFNPSLEQLSIHSEITPRTSYLTHSRWSFGIYGGYGVNKEGSSLQVGVGIMYKIL